MTRANLSDFTYAASDHLLIIGLLSELPPVGETFSEEKRQAWVAAALAAFAVLYEQPAERET